MYLALACIEGNFLRCYFTSLIKFLIFYIILIIVIKVINKILNFLFVIFIYYLNLNIKFLFFIFYNSFVFLYLRYSLIKSSALKPFTIISISFLNIIL